MLEAVELVKTGTGRGQQNYAFLALIYGQRGRLGHGLVHGLADGVGAFALTPRAEIIGGIADQIGMAYPIHKALKPAQSAILGLATGNPENTRV